MSVFRANAPALVFLLWAALIVCGIDLKVPMLVLTAVSIVVMVMELQRRYRGPDGY